MDTWKRESRFSFFVQVGPWSLPSYPLPSLGHLEPLLACVSKHSTEITVLLTICFLTLDFQGILHRRRLRGPGVRVREPQQQQHEPVHLRGRGTQVLLVPGERAVLQPRRGRQ